MGRKKTDSLARSVALRVSLAVASESFCCVKLKYCEGGVCISIAVGYESLVGRVLPCLRPR